MMMMTKKTSFAKGSTMRRGLVVLSAVLLSACSGLLPQPAPAPAVYDLGPAGAAISAPVRSADVSAPDWLDSNGMLYRLGDPQRVQRFTEARWASTPAQLLAERFRQRLVAQASGRPLGMALEGFEQRFSSSTQSEVVVRVRATLGDQQKVFEVRQPGGANAASGARAMAAAADALVEQVLAWAGTVPATATSASSAPTNQ